MTQTIAENFPLSMSLTMASANGLDGAHSVTISPDGNNVYVASFHDDAIVVFSRDVDDSGKLSFVDVLKLYAQSL